MYKQSQLSFDILYFYYHIPMTLKEYLKSHKITKEEFANSLGVSYGSIIKWT